MIFLYLVMIPLHNLLILDVKVLTSKFCKICSRGRDELLHFRQKWISAARRRWFFAYCHAFEREICNCAKEPHIYIYKIFYLDSLCTLSLFLSLSLSLSLFLLRHDRVAAINGLISYAGTPNVPPRCVRERAWEKAGFDITHAAHKIIATARIFSI